MQNFDAAKYVKENSGPLALTDHTNIGDKLRCIDDRASDVDADKPIAVPGGGLGIVMDALGALTLLRRAGKHVTFTPQEIIDAVSRAIGVINFHTDEKSVKNRGVACGGCGHCNGALADPVRYLLSETDAKFFSETGLDELKLKLKEKGKGPSVYTGRHSASAVMIVEGENISLPSVGKSGEHVYVYHKNFHERLLSLVAHELSPLLSGHTQGVSDADLERALLESAQARLSVTLEKLAAGLPRFRVGKNIAIAVEPA